MKGKVYKLYLLLFTVAICLPWAFWSLPGEDVDSGSCENRTGVEKPAFRMDDYISYPSEYEAYFNDRIPFRNQLTAFYSWLNYRLFHTSVNSDVILGRDKWLFYGSTGDGDPIGDYEGTNIFLEEEVSRMKDAAMNLQCRLGEMGIQAAVIIPPNKERIYGQYMPGCYVPAEDSRSDLMVEVLQDAQVNIINPKKDLMDLKYKYQLYYAYDTHWNQLGAYVGTRSVLEAWGMELPALTELTISSADLKDNYHICGLDDLANMLNLRQTVFQDEIEYSIEENYHMDWQQVTDGLVHIENTQAPCRKKVFLIGDSFRVSMIPALASYFSDVYAVHRGIIRMTC